jgi:hypothetical protein
MALSFTQLPLDETYGETMTPVIINWTPAIGYMLEQDSSIAAFYYYRLVLEIREDDASGTVLGIIKQRRNGLASDVTSNLARAFFDLKDIVKSQLVPTVYDQNQTSPPFVTIHKLGFNGDQKSFSLSGDALKGKGQLLKVYVKGYQNYSTAANTSPADVTTGSVNSTLWYLYASLPLATEREAVSGADPQFIQGDAFSKYRASFYNNYFLSDVIEAKMNNYRGVNINTSSSVLVNYVQWDATTSTGDWHTVAFLNNKGRFYSNVLHIEVVYFDASHSATNVVYFDNETSKGGFVPSGTSTKYNSLIYFGCGTANLENQGFSNNAKPSHANNTNWTYYTIRGTSGDDDSANADGSTGYPLDQSYHQTQKYYFIRDPKGSCKSFKIRRLAWANNKGGYDYYNFKMKSTQTLEVKRDNYQTILGNYGQEYYSYNDTGRGKTTRKVTAILKETLQTDFITESEAQLLESLITSNRVDIVANADTTYTESVMVTDTSFIKKTTANDGIRIQYTINIEYANPRNTNT